MAYQETSREARNSVHNPIARLYRSLLRDLAGAYRPELYYMRGPGPKWHEKNTSPQPALADMHASKPAT